MIVDGEQHSDDAESQAGQLTLHQLFLSFSSCSCTHDYTGTDVEIGGEILTPGVYCYANGVDITGTLTLNADPNNPNAIFVFLIGSALNTMTDSQVVLGTGVSPCNVFWIVGSSATIGIGTEFQGIIIADQAISLDTSASVVGALYTLVAAVTLIENDVTRCNLST